MKIRKRVLNTEVDLQSVKGIIDRVIPGGAILNRLLKGEHLVWPGLNTCNRIFELNHKTLKSLYLLFRMNLASVLMIKSMASPLDPSKAIFLVQLAKYAVKDATENQEFWNNALPNNQQKQLLTQAEMTLRFFKIVAYYAVLRCNLFEKDNLMVKKKNYNQIMWENYLLASGIQTLKKEIAHWNIDSKFDQILRDNKIFVPDFVEFYMKYYVDDCLKTYEYLKDSIGEQIMSSPDQILDYVACTVDFIDNVFAKC